MCVSLNCKGQLENIEVDVKVEEKGHVYVNWLHLAHCRVQRMFSEHDNERIASIK